MRLAVLSDIHGNLTALDAALADLDAVGEVDLVWFLGDLAAFGPRPAECIRRVRELAEHYGKDKFRSIGGNTDRYLVTGERMKMPAVKDEETFAKLARRRSTVDEVLNWNLSQLSWEDYEYLTGILYRETRTRVDDYGVVIGYHAIPGDDEAQSLRPDTPEEEFADALLDREGQLAIGGHIHVQMDRSIPRWRVVNVGSIGMSFDMPGKAQWGLFTFTDSDVTVDLRAVEYDVDAAIADMQASGHPYPDWAANRMRKGV